MKLFNPKKSFNFLKVFKEACLFKTSRLLFLLLILGATGGYAQDSAIDPSVTKLANQVMMNIYDDILRVKEKYPVLSDFGPQTLSKNVDGIYVLHYSQPSSSETPFEFGLTIVKTNEHYFDKNLYSVFNLGFSLLDLKITGFEKNTTDNTLHINLPIQKYGQLLWDEQQRLLPLQLSLEATKDHFAVGEIIVFTVKLMNTSPTALKIKDINTLSIHFWYDNTEVSVADSTGTLSEKLIILQPQESLTRHFQLEGFRTPGEHQILVSYILTFKGVNPAAILNIQVSP